MQDSFKTMGIPHLSVNYTQIERFLICHSGLSGIFLCTRVSLWKQGRGKEGVPYDSWQAGRMPDKPAWQNLGEVYIMRNYINRHV